MMLRPARALVIRCLTLAVCLVALTGTASAASVNMTNGSSGEIIRWSSSTVKYQLHPACSADLSAAACLAEVRKSFKAWEPPACSNLTFTEGAASYNLKLTAVGYNTNGANEFAWIENSAWQSGKYVLGVTSPVFYTTGNKAGAIFEADIAMNGYLQTWSMSGKNYSTDVMNVSVHEIGHFFGLQHNLYPSKTEPETMGPTADPFMGSRTPAQDDINGMCFLYPAGKGLPCASNKDCPYVVDDGPSGEFYVGQISCASNICNGPAASVPTGGKKLGDACVSDIDCGTPTFCQPLSGSQSVCSQTCNPTQSGACPSGFACQKYQGSTTQGACIKSTGSGTTGTKDLGETCAASAECKSQLCVNSGGQTTCEQPCTTDGNCASGETCSKFVGKSYGACIKASGGGTTPGKKADGAVCTASTQCDSNICVGSGGSGLCTPNCATAACKSGFNCLQLTSGKKACFPGGSKKLGETCSSSSDCASSICGPSDGTYMCTQLCGAGQATCPTGYQCFQVSGGASACFPAAKKKGDGEACAGSSDCNSGLCIGGAGAGTCVQPCSTDSQCASGFTCSPLSGGGGACTKLGDKQMGDSCTKPSECSTGACLTVDGKSTCSATCNNTGDCPCGHECTTFQSGAKYCTAGKKVACVTDGLACVGDEECVSDLCLNQVCAASCSIFSASSGCPTGKACVRLEANNPKGVCSTKGPEGFGAVCSGDTTCAALFCDKGKCGQACNPFGPNSCPFGLVCEVAQGSVGSCTFKSSGAADAGGSNQDAGAIGDAGGTTDAGAPAPDVVAGTDGGGEDTAAVADSVVSTNDTQTGTQPSTTAPADSGGLCSAAPAGNPNGLAGLLALAMLVLLAYRRRHA